MVQACFACIEGSYKSSSCCLFLFLATYIQFTLLYLLLGKERKKERKKESTNTLDNCIPDFLSRFFGSKCKSAVGLCSGAAISLVDVTSAIIKERKRRKGNERQRKAEHWEQIITLYTMVRNDKCKKITAAVKLTTITIMKK